MFGSGVLEVGVGLIFTFLAVSLVSGTVVEAVNSAIKLRSRTLLAGVKALLNDPNFEALAKDLYAHAAVNPRGPGMTDPAKSPPAYIDKNQFAAAFMDITNISKIIAAHIEENAADAPGMVPPVAPGPSLVERLKAAVDAKIGPAAADAEPAASANAQIQQLLHGIIYRSLGDADKMKLELANWFDNAMDRVSGVYKRYTQAMAVGVALVVAVALNINTITIAKAVWEQPALVENIKVQKSPPSADEALKLLDQNLPIGWQGTSMPRAHLWDWFVAVCGWLLTAFSALFGAPFWFDALQQITRLKGAGPSPNEKQSGTAAAA